LSNRLALPMIRELVPDGFGYGVNLLVEFDPKSVWYETSLTIAAQAVRDGIKTDYHTFQHMPNEVVEALAKFGLDIEKSEEDGTLSIIDSYTVQLGMGPGKKATGRVHHQTQSVKLADWSIAMAQEIRAGAPQAEKKRLHIDDNTSVLLQYNDVKQFIDFWRTRSIPMARSRELAFVHSLVTGVYSDAFCRQWESLCDGIIEFKSEETGGSIEHFVRVRSVRGKSYDSRWHQLKVLQNGEVRMAN
jgi:KaiC/GvpD/RAD55 family RecA-like ATPase